ALCGDRLSVPGLVSPLPLADAGGGPAAASGHRPLHGPDDLQPGLPDVASCLRAGSVPDALAETPRKYRPGIILTLMCRWIHARASLRGYRPNTRAWIRLCPGLPHPE